MAFRILGSDSGKRSAAIKGRVRKGRMVAGKWIGTCSVIADGRVFIVGEVDDRKALNGSQTEEQKGGSGYE